MHVCSLASLMLGKLAKTDTQLHKPHWLFAPLRSAQSVTSQIVTAIRTATRTRGGLTY